jgi:LacI family transcriptional regulator
MSTQLPSIVDVAKKAGVSVATASRVMSSSPYRVSAEARQKVITAAQELDYVPNSLARSLKVQRSKLIAVLVGDNADPYFAQVTRGIEEIANANGYLTIICNTDRDPSRELMYLRTLQDYRADGIILAGSSFETPSTTEIVTTIINSIQSRGAAIVSLSSNDLEAPTIQIDNIGGAQALTAHLIELGHRRIAFIAGPEHLKVAEQRKQGYQQALAEAGIDFQPELVLAGNFTQAQGEAAAYQLAQFSAADRPSAVFASNDETAFGLMSGLSQLGWRIPDDISICGFGDVPMAKMVTPGLTTVHIAMRELGQAGANKILALLNHEVQAQASSLETLPTTIVERASTRVLTRQPSI